MSPDVGQADEPVAPLRLEHTIALAGVAGRIDHIAVDLARKRLLVAELGNGTVDIIDLANGKTIRRLNGLREPQGVGYAPKADVMAVSSAEDGTVSLFGGADYQPIGSVGLGEDADNIRLDPRTGHFIVGYGTGGLAEIDPLNRSLVSQIKLPSHPEGFQLDPVRRLAFINLPDARQVAVVDLATGKQTATWPLPDLTANFPMARDDDEAVLAVVFRSPTRLVLLDPSDGKVRVNLQTCRDADDVFFDGSRRRIYVSCGEGLIDVFERDGTGYRPPIHVKTAPGARTSLFVPELNQFFVAARAGFFGMGSDAAILVYRVQP